MKVLLADDHEHVLWGLKKLVDGEWPRMMVSGTARTVNEVLTAIGERKPDVIVLDVFLGTENALDHLQRMRDLSGAQIIVLTGAPDAEVHRRAMKEGARAVILKNAPAEVLLGEIEKARREGRGAAR